MLWKGLCDEIQAEKLHYSFIGSLDGIDCDFLHCEGLFTGGGSSPGKSSLIFEAFLEKYQIEKFSFPV